MNRFTLTLMSGMLFFLAFGDTAMANKFTTIGGGVSGGSQEKLQILKTIGAYSGLLLLFLGLMGILTKSRYEGFIGAAKGNRKVSPGVYALLVVGGLLSLLFLF